MTLVSVFVFFVFSTLGLGLVYLSQAYLKLSAYQKNSMLSAFSSENGIKQGYAQLAQLVSGKYFPPILSESQYKELKDDAMGGGTKAIEEALGVLLPERFGETWGGQSWSGAAQFGPARILESDGYFLAETKGEITAEGSLEGDIHKKNRHSRSD